MFRILHISRIHFPRFIFSAYIRAIHAYVSRYTLCGLCYAVTLVLDSEYAGKRSVFMRRSIPGGLESSAVWVQVASTDKYLSRESSDTKEHPLVLAVAVCQLIPDRAEIEYL